jgi:hypothetical protein
VRSGGKVLRSRGTHYEIEIIQGEVFIAVWDGAVDVSVGGEGQLHEVGLGEGEDYSYAKINETGEVTELLEPPSTFDDGHSSDPGDDSKEEVEADGSDDEAQGDGPDSGESSDEGDAPFGPDVEEGSQSPPLGSGEKWWDTTEPPPVETAATPRARPRSPSTLDPSLTGAQVLDLLASGGVAGSVSVDSSASRYRRVKQNLANAMRGYVAKDISTFMDLFARSFTQDLTIFRNAVNDDFVNDNDISVDLELLSYQLSQDTVGLSLIWNRTSTASNGGAPTVERGSSRLIFDRNDDFRVKTWLDSTPFGRRDQALRAQVQGGQVNDQTGIPTPTATTTAPTPDPPVTVAWSPASDFNNALAVDVDLGISRPFSDSLTPNVGDFAAGEDFSIHLGFGVPNPRVQVLSNTGGAVARCVGLPAPTQIGDIRNLISTSITAGNSTFATANGSQEVFGLRTPGGKFVVLEVPAEPSTSQSIRYQVHTATSFSASGTVDCPTVIPLP